MVYEKDDEVERMKMRKEDDFVYKWIVYLNSKGKVLYKHDRVENVREIENVVINRICE